MTPAERTKLANVALGSCYNTALSQTSSYYLALRECVRLAECWDKFRGFLERIGGSHSSKYLLDIMGDFLNPRLWPEIWSDEKPQPPWRDELGVRRGK